MEQTIEKKLSVNDIKKLLYKQSPIAELKYIRKGHAYYTVGVEHNSCTHTINFEIPISDMGDADFHRVMESKLLIRWIMKEDETN